ncbi:MAG TPA: hypothetical protein VKF84_18320, partial [Candidatus Sulfotelmatobacter sp.]|nr:hypothetical protein [Candidatus Sulfotelmatobacter sp.]
KVWARSKPGQGTTFVIKLRRLDAERPVSPGDSMADKSLADKARELVGARPAATAAGAGAGAGGRLHG